MKKISFYVHSKSQLKNKIFYPDKNDYVNSDNRMLFFFEFKKKLFMIIGRVNGNKIYDKKLGF